jgi:hypothetical protein
MASAVPRRLYADFCNKIGAKRTFAATLGQQRAGALLVTSDPAHSAVRLCNLRIEKPYVKRRKAYLLQSRQVS